MGRMVVELPDARGVKSKMVRIPRFNWEDIDPALGTGVHNAFITGSGVMLDEIYVGAHQALVEEGTARVALKGENTTSITFDEARAACAAMGPGWHLTTAWEYSAAVLWCLMTKKKPFSFCWWEWIDLLKLVDGRFLCPEYNAVGMPESIWPAHDVFFDAMEDDIPVLSDGVNRRLGPEGSDESGNYGYLSSWANLKGTAGYEKLEERIHLLMKRLLIAPVSGLTDRLYGSVWMRNYGERLPFRGGGWNSSASDGLASLALGYRRSCSGSTIGLRPAFIPPENLKPESLEN